MKHLYIYVKRFLMRRKHGIAPCSRSSITHLICKYRRLYNQRDSSSGLTPARVSALTFSTVKVPLSYCPDKLIDKPRHSPSNLNLEVTINCSDTRNPKPSAKNNLRPSTGTCLRSCALRHTPSCRLNGCDMMRLITIEKKSQLCFNN